MNQFADLSVHWFQAIYLDCVRRQHESYHHSATAFLLFLQLSATGTAVNFIKLNAMAASRQQVKRPPSQQSLEQSMNMKAERYNEYKRNTKGSVPK